MQTAVLPTPAYACCATLCCGVASSEMPGMMAVSTKTEGGPPPPGRLHCWPCACAGRSPALASWHLPAPSSCWERCPSSYQAEQLVEAASPAFRTGLSAPFLHLQHRCLGACPRSLSAEHSAGPRPRLATLSTLSLLLSCHVTPLKSIPGPSLLSIYPYMLSGVFVGLRHLACPIGDLCMTPCHDAGDRGPCEEH